MLCTFVEETTVDHLEKQHRANLQVRPKLEKFKQYFLNAQQLFDGIIVLVNNGISQLISNSKPNPNPCLGRHKSYAGLRLGIPKVTLGTSALFQVGLSQYTDLHRPPHHRNREMVEFALA